MSSVLALSAKGASFLILIQICSRALTFIINQLLLRHLSPEILGVSTQLELYSITVLYFSRESFRIALQRPTSNAQVAVNIACIPLLLGVLVSVSLGLLYSHSESLSSVPSIVNAFALTGLGSLIKLIGEPCFAVVQQYLFYSIRARAEGGAAIARCIATYLAVMYYKNRQNQVGAIPFALGLLISGIVQTLIYYALTIPIARRERFSLLPRRLLTNSANSSDLMGGYLSRSLCNLSLNLYLQSGVKYILTRGDSLLITSLASLHDQGAYALATNYGSLIARTVFQPIEESSRNLFAKLCLPTDAPSTDSNDKKPSDERKDSPPTTTTTTKEDASNTKSIRQGSQLLSNFLHLYAILSLISISIGPPAAPLLLHVVAGDVWTATNAPQVLATYAYYIPFLAVNGVTEAFVAAVASTGELRQQSTFMIANFAGFAAATWGFVSGAGLGAKGLVWACCVALAGRCVFNGVFIWRFFARRGVKVDFVAMLPNVGSVAAAVVVVGIVRAGKYAPGILGDEALDQLLGVCGLAAGLGVAILAFEWRFMWSSYRMLVSG